MRPKKYKKCPLCKSYTLVTNFYRGEDICRTCSNVKRKRIPKKYLVRGAIQYPSSSSLGVSYA